MGAQSLQDLNDQLNPDTLTLEEWRRAQAQTACDSTPAASDDTDDGSNEHPTTGGTP
jgi:hypothetical protein